MGKHFNEKCENGSGPSLVHLRLTVVAGGLLGMAFLPLAAAHADDWTVTPDPSSTEHITGIYGHGFDGGDTAPPAVVGSIQGSQIFDWTNTTTSQSGKFAGLESYSNDNVGDINTEVYVAGDVTGSGGPAVGSVFDSYSFDNGFTNLYSAIPNGNGTATVTDTLVTPLGSVAVPTTFDAADGLIADAGGVGTGNGGSLIPVGTQQIMSINGIPPLTVALQGTQDFKFLDTAGDAAGTVGTVDTTTTDGAGTYTEAVLVTSDDTGTVGTTAADVPAVGSIFNTINFGGIVNSYSDYVSAGGNQLLDTLYTPLGSMVIPTTFDAAKVEDLSNTTLTLPNGMVFDPATGLTVTGINGLPPVDVGVQGTQNFNFTDGASSGTFTADVTNTLDEFNDATETILVTSSKDPNTLPVGSEFEIVNIGYGYESIYTDIAGATAAQDVMTETLVTPFGDISIPPPFDVASELIGASLSG